MKIDARLVRYLDEHAVTPGASETTLRELSRSCADETDRDTDDVYAQFVSILDFAADQEREDRLIAVGGMTEVFNPAHFDLGYSTVGGRKYPRYFFNRPVVPDEPRLDNSPRPTGIVNRLRSAGATTMPRRERRRLILISLTVVLICTLLLGYTAKTVWSMLQEASVIPKSSTSVFDIADPRVVVTPISGGTVTAVEVTADGKTQKAEKNGDEWRLNLSDQTTTPIAVKVTAKGRSRCTIQARDILIWKSVELTNGGTCAV